MRFIYWLVGVVLGALLTFSLTSLINAILSLDLFEGLDIVRAGSIIGLIGGPVAADYIWRRQKRFQPEQTERRAKYLLAWPVLSILATITMFTLSSEVFTTRTAPPPDSKMTAWFNNKRGEFDNVGRYLDGDNNLSDIEYNHLLTDLRLSEYRTGGSTSGGTFLVYWSYESKGPLYSDFTDKGYCYSRKPPAQDGNCLTDGDVCNPVTFHRIYGSWYTYELSVPG